MISKFKDEYRFLSNFWPCPIAAMYKIWPSAEHLYHAAKTDNLEEQIMIFNCKTAVDAKKMGKTVTLRPNWNKLKVDFMRKIVEKKFTQNPKLALRLVETGNQELVEGNHWNDTFWGICNNVGENWLGKILMEVRAGLKVHGK